MDNLKTVGADDPVCPKPKRNTQSGITLIALIITIIILLILAMVTIRILMNQGIIKHARNATDAYNEAQNNEAALLAYQEGIMDQLAGGNSNTSEDIDLLERYCLGDDKNGLDLLSEVLNVNTMTFIDREPIPEASTKIIYNNIGEKEENGSYLIYIYFIYEETPYQLITEVDTNTNAYTTKAVEKLEATIIVLDKESMELNVDENSSDGEIQMLTAKLYGETTDTVNWSVDNSSIATINQTTGNSIEITAKSAGTTNVIATCGESMANCRVTVKSGMKYKNVFLAVGDYIAYDATKDANGNTVASQEYTSYSPANSSSNKNNGRTSGYGGGDQTFNVNNYNKGWKVLGIRNGQIELISADTVGSLVLNSNKGFQYGIDELNAISDIYGHGKGAVRGRSISIEDINEMVGYTPSTPTTYVYTKNENGFIYRNDGKGGEDENFYYYDETGSVWKNLLNTGDSKEMQHTYYGYSIYPSNRFYQIIGGGYNDLDYWLASRVVQCRDGYADYDMRIIKQKKTQVAGLGNSRNGTASSPHGVRPVITLSSDVELTGKINGEWQIK